jgi:heme/copper-type cytochrome/quinol oxidase subunit 2
MIRKVVAVILIGLVLFFTSISILAIWDFIQIEDVISKSFTTLLIITASAAVMLFVFSVLYKSDDERAGTRAKENTPPV